MHGRKFFGEAYNKDTRWGEIKNYIRKYPHPASSAMVEALVARSWRHARFLISAIVWIVVIV